MYTSALGMDLLFIFAKLVGEKQALLVIIIITDRFSPFIFLPSTALVLYYFISLSHLYFLVEVK